MAEHLDIIRRGWKWLIVGCLVGAVAGYGVSRAVPTRYTSKATVDIGMPMDGTASVERTLAPERLQGLVEHLGLYSSAGPMENRLAAMRRDVAVTQAGPKSSFFTISYTSGKPEAAQRVCSELASLVRDDAGSARPQPAAGAAGSSSAPHSATLDFLAAQIEEAKRNRDRADARLAEFNRQHAAERAGGDSGDTRKKLAEYNAQLQSLDAGLKNAQDRRAALTETLFTPQPGTPQNTKTADAARRQALEQELAAKQEELAALQTRYTPDHPDMVKLRSDVANLQKKLDQAKQASGASTAKGSDAGAEAEHASQIQAQIHALDSEIQEKTRERGRVQLEIQASQVRLESSVIPEAEYRELARESETAKAFYDGLLAKQSDALKAAEAEQRQQRAVFRLAAPASLPDLPSSPDRFLFATAGAAGGLVLAIPLVLLGKMRDKTLRTEDDVERLLDLPTLAVIPAAEISSGKNSWGGMRNKEEGVLTDV
jgi:uncharacterized protein involved in exopolysaccharide biosynthesis